ncbi:MAG: zinc ABC transporter substrate-binding protein [Bacteroidales bacterium]|nr:zinc ABC transporter substrate-binding protein [Bacteroidales bacterium]
MARLSIYILLFIFIACNPTQPTPTENERPTITVTIPAQKFFVERLVGDAVGVNVMIPKSVGHADYTPQPRQIMALSNSTAYFAIGNLDFEITWRERLIDASANNNWIALNAGIEDIDNNDDDHTDADHHHHDPHYWLSPKRVLVMIDNMHTALNAIVPDEAAHIDSAAVALSAEVAMYDSVMHTLGGRTFLIYHPALTCVAQDYNLTQLEIEHDGNAPTPKTLETQLCRAKELGVQTVFVQPGYDTEKATSIANQIGARVVNIDPEAEDWENTIHNIIDALK